MSDSDRQPNQMLFKPSDADIDFIVAVRNDPETRRNSRRQHELTWQDLIGAPNGGTRETLVAKQDETNVGYVHLDRLDGLCELSWVVAPSYRGNGIGTKMVSAALLSAARSEIIAEIRPDNVASILIAKRCGFQLAERHDDFLLFRISC